MQEMVSDTKMDDFVITEGYTHPVIRREDFGKATARLPYRPYCTNDLSHGLKIRDLDDALNMPYLQLNPPHLRAWMTFDIDRESACYEWMGLDGDLPIPSLIAVNPENGHAHYTWGLEAPVLVDSPDMRQAPLKYLCAIEAAYRDMLQADRGYSGLVTKHPFHKKWYNPHPLNVILLYSLTELADYIEDLSKYTPKRGKKVEEIGLGRNVTLFDWLRNSAYRQIRKYKKEGDYRAWQAVMNAKALERNGEFKQPLFYNEVRHIARSVGKWTWYRFDIAASDARYSALQAHRGKQNKPETQAIKGSIGGLGNSAEVQATKGRISGLNRMAASEDKRATARLMRATGMTLRAIAEELGISKSTIGRWLAEV